MKTKEKLERAGWVFQFEMDNYLIEVYARGNLRIVFMPVTDEAKVYYDITKEQSTPLKSVDDILLEIFCEPLKKETNEKDIKDET